MFILRINRLRVFDNRTRRAFLGLVGEDAANVQVVSFVSTDQTTLPDLTRFVDTNDETERAGILRQMVSRTLSQRIFTAFPRVKDGHILTFGDTGFAVHQSPDFVSFLDWTLVVIKSNRPTRNLGIRMEEVLSGENGATLQANLLQLLSTAAGTINPAYLAAAGIARFVGEIAADVLKEKNDEVLGLFYTSLSEREHYPHGERKADAAPGVSGNISVDYSLFGLRPEIRRAIPVERTLLTPPSEPLPPDDAPARPVVAVPPAPTAPPDPVESPVLRTSVPRRRIGGMVDADVYSFEGERAFFFVSDLDVDADGSPRAYHPTSSKGLDHLANAGKPGNWWGVVCQPNGKPYVQRASDPAPGYHVSCTSLFDPSKDERDPKRYVDAETIPYFVLPSSHGTDARPGDLGVIVNLATRRFVGAIFADVGGSSHVGEASIAAATALGIPANPRNGGTGSGILYLVFPGSGNRRPKTAAKIEAETAALFNEWGGLGRIAHALNPAAAPPRPLPQPAIAVTSGPLEQLVAADASVTMEEIRDDRALARQVQTILIRHGLLDPPVDGLWGSISRCAWSLFHDLTHVGAKDRITKAAAERLLASAGQDLIPLTFDDDWIGRTCQFLLQQGHWLARGPGLMNILYLEGINADGTLNDDAPNAFNDLRLVIEIAGGRPVVRGKWQATTEPGHAFTESPLSSAGAARIAFGQYKAWQVGQHPRNSPNSHEALRQVKPIKVHRDFNKDHQRDGDNLDEGLFGINQHWGYDLPENAIGEASAGCLVGRTRAGHREFMALVKSDVRFLASPTYQFLTTILDARAIGI